MHTIVNSDLLLPISLAIIGGFVRVLRSGRERSIGKVLAALVVAGFVGMLTYLVIRDFRIPEGMKAAFVGASGLSSGGVVRFIEGIMRSEISNKSEER